MQHEFDDVIYNEDCEAPEGLFTIMNYEVDYLLKIGMPDGKDLVTIKPDGTIEIHEYGAEREAAEIFWGALQMYGKSCVDQIKELQDKVVELTKENEGLKNK